MAMRAIAKILEKADEGKHMMPRTIPAKRGYMKKIGILSAILRIGPTKSRALLQEFKTVHGVFNATTERLQMAPGIGPATAQRIWSILHDE
jgi:ERCC4-type nuclease